MFTGKAQQPALSTKAGQDKEGLSKHLLSLLLSLLFVVEDMQARFFSCVIMLVSHRPF